MRMVAIFAVFSLGFLLCTCDQGAITCQTIYDECENLITVAEDSFVDNCVAEYHDEDEDCQYVLQIFADCTQDNACSDLACLQEYLNIALQCGVDALGLPFVDP